MKIGGRVADFHVNCQRMYKRKLELDTILNRKSVFLFGPRQTGKSTWLKENYPKALYINLLQKKTFDHFFQNGNALESEIKLFQRNHKSNIIIIDEIQKIPQLLDEVHNQIEENKKLRFILTGSSARKLKRMGANLLGGRASWRNMFPLVYPEIKSELSTINDLERRLLIGGIPSLLTSAQPFEDFDDYIQLYLNEEIRAEGAVRNYEAFHRFLTTSALMNSKQVNFTQLGSDAQIPPRTVQDYFQILEDTLIGFLLPGFIETPTRKAMSTAKFYLFDTGLANALLKRESLRFGSPEFGDLFEHYVISEVRAYNSYQNRKAELFYWRSTSQFEVDLIIKSKEEVLAVEIKSKSNISKKDIKGLIAFSEDYPKSKKIVITVDSKHFLDSTNNVEIIPIFEFLKLLWNGKLF